MALNTWRYRYMNINNLDKRFKIPKKRQVIFCDQIRENEILNKESVQA